MTVSNTESRWQYVGDGVTATFPFTNLIFAATDLAVYWDETLKTLGPDYTIAVASIGKPTGGNVVFLPLKIPPAGVTVTLLRAVPETQLADLEARRSLPADVVEGGLDKNCVLIQQLHEGLDRALTVPPTDEGSDMELPSSEARANKVFAFDGDGNPVPSNLTLAELEAQASAGEASAAEAAASAAAADASADAAAGFSTAAGNSAANAAASAAAAAASAAAIPPLPITIDKGGTGQITAPLAREALGADLAGNVYFTQPGLGAVSRSVLMRLRDIVHVADFGVVGDGVADDTAAIHSALNSLSVGGGVVYFARGSYNVSSVITVPAGVTLMGAGRYASLLRTSSATETVLLLGDACNVIGFKIQAFVTRTSGLDIDCQGNAITIRECDFYYYYVAVAVGTAGGALRVGNRIVDCHFNGVAAPGSGAIRLLNFSNAVVQNCIIAGPLAGTQPNFGIQVRNGDTCFLSGNNVTLHGKALLVDPPAGQNTFGLYITGCIFDSAGTVTGGGTVPSGDFSPQGGVYDTNISNCWFGLASPQQGLNLLPIGAGVIDGMNIVGCAFADNGDYVLLIVAPAKNITVTGGYSSGHSAAGIRIGGAATHIIINGHRAGNVGARSANAYGILVDAAAANHYVITNCNLQGNTIAGILDQGTGTNKTISGNIS